MVTVVKSPLDFLFAQPEPREISLLGGLTELSEDVRLVTSNVAPLYRKTMRTVLATAGIKVVANKKKFIIEVKVEPADLFDFKGVPAQGREEYYEIELLDNAVTVRTATQLGALWGAHSLAGIYRAKAKGHAIPNMKIRDWPDHPVRAGFMVQTWGFERWTMEEWTACVERLAAGKLNAFAIPFDAGFQNLFGPATEGIVTAVPEHPEWQRESMLHWYSPGLKIWRTDTSPAKFQTENFVPQLLVCARENGLNTMPLFSLLGDGTPIPRLAPAISACDGAGKPSGQGYCFANPETRKVLGEVYGGIMDRHFAGGTDFVVLRVGGRTATAACGCPKCKKKPAAESAREQLVWLAKLLLAKNAKSIVLWLAPDADAAIGNADLAKVLAKEKILDRVAVVAVPEAGAKTGGKKAAGPASLRRWVASPVRFTSWQSLDKTRGAVEQALADASAANTEGTACEVVLDSLWYDHIEHFANNAWCSTIATTHQRKQEELAELHAGHDKVQFLAARRAFETAVMDPCGFSRYLGIPSLPQLFKMENGTFDIGPALKDLCSGTQKAIRAQLPKIAAAAHATLKTYAAFLDKEVKPDDVEIFKCQLCEATRVAALAMSLETLAGLYDGVARKKIDPKYVKQCADLHAALIDLLNVFETRRSKFVAPLKMAELSPFLALVDKLNGRMKELQAGKPKAIETAWTVTLPPPAA